MYGKEDLLNDAGEVVGYTITCRGEMRGFVVDVLSSREVVHAHIDRAGYTMPDKVAEVKRKVQSMC